MSGARPEIAPLPQEDVRYCRGAGWLEQTVRFPEGRSRRRYDRARCRSTILATRGCAKRSMPTPRRSWSFMKRRSTLVHLHRQPPMDGLPKHGLARAERQLFLDWYVPAVGLEGPDQAGWDQARGLCRTSYSDGLAPVTVRVRLSCRKCHAGRWKRGIDGSVTGFPGRGAGAPRR